MQIQSLRLKCYRSWRIDERKTCPIAQERLFKLQSFWQLKSEGCSEKAALTALKTSRSTMYRWQADYRRGGMSSLSPKSTQPHQKRQPMWSRQLEQRVLHLRKQYPLWGKRTMATILNREHDLIFA